jgi:hypothetical protein
MASLIFYIQLSSLKPQIAQANIKEAAKWQLLKCLPNR